MTKAPATEGWRGTTLVLAVHGIQGGPGCAVAHAADLRRRGLFRSVLFGCHKGAPDLVDVVRGAAPGPVLVAPLLMAEAYTLRAMTRRLDDGAGRPFRIAPVLGTHPRFAGLIVREGLAGCAARGWRPGGTALLLVGHGTRRDPNSGATARRHAESVRASGRFAEVAVGFLDEAPAVPDALAGLQADRCVAVGLFLDRGEHGEEDVPALLEAGAKAAVYSGPIGIDPLVPDLVLDLLGTPGAVTVAA
ncbi:MAG TPA: CbiX/SirB N-terminal domain-containing protein [Geminicoccaceae bacterium]